MKEVIASIMPQLYIHYTKYLSIILSRNFESSKLIEANG